MTQSAPYGIWSSPITADSIVQSSSSVDDVIVDPVTSKVYHIEKRPSEAGRNVLVRTEDGTDVFGKEWNCRSGVHEYGGGAATVYDGKIYFSNFADGRVYLVNNGEGGEPEPITPESTVFRYAVFAVHPWYQHLIVAVQEDHTKPAPADVVNRLCLIDAQEKHVTTLASGADFYASPCFSPDGSHIAWQQWNHPDMPWEGSQLWVAMIKADEEELRLKDAKHISGKAGTVSAGYPVWVSNETLVFTSDASGYQNPWIYSLSMGEAKAALEKPVPEDFSQPAWTLGGSYGAQVDTEGKMALFTAVRDGRSVLYVVSLHCGTLEEIECPYAVVRSVRPVVDRAAVFIGTKDDSPSRIVLCVMKDYSKPKYTILKAQNAAAEEPSVPAGYISKPIPLTLEVPPNNDPLHVVLYPPTNPDFKGPADGKPPCIVNVHGGPTSFADQGFDITKQFFTSRGFAWLDVNYGGSSCYGRAYTDRLRGTWGVVDVRDCALAVTTLAKTHGLIDATRTAIRGRSSGGFTVLAAACAYPTVFAAATSHFGISDLVKLDEFTHKFESKYCETLIGGSPREVPEVYRERSPVHHADKIKAPLLILQGALDAVVPPEQAEDIVKTIKEKGGRVEYVLFEGEGHGFRKAENIKAALERELAFYQDVFGLKQ